MPLKQLFSWLRIAQIEKSRPTEVLELVEAALETVEEDDPRYELLLQIEEELNQGRVPLQLLQQLKNDEAFHENSEELDEVARLEAEYRELAARYSDQQWQTNHFLEFSKHLAESEDEELLEFADSLRAKLSKAWSRYHRDFTIVSGHCARTEVGHRLLKDGYHAWIDALDMLEEDFSDEEVLESAEIAVRLLVAVGQLDRDAKRDAASITFRKDH